MKSILLTSTALVMVAGIAAADGHSSISWSGSAKAGIAREGSDEAKAAGKVGSSTAAVLLQETTDYITKNASVAGRAAGGIGHTRVKDATVGATALGYVETKLAALTSATTITAAEFVRLRISAVEELAASIKAANGNPNAIKTAQTLHDNRQAAYNHLAGTAATVKADAGNFQAYSEVNATVTGTVTAGGMILSAGVSLDAGNGYDFADDDGFDNSSATYEGGRVSLDAVSLDMGTAGKLTLNDDAIAHLVDGDDDAAADVSYANTFGGATFTAAMDLDKDDSDIAAAKAGVGSVATATAAATATKAAVAIGDFAHGSAAVAADVQWSAKVEMPIGAGTVYVAMDEESGNAFGGSAVVGGMTVSIDSKLEALGSDLKSNRQNTLGVEMERGPIKGKFTYDSLKDGNQWGVSAGYTAGDMSVAFATNEASSWNVTGGYALGTGASIEAGVNYTEDAYLGLSFAF